MSSENVLGAANMVPLALVCSYHGAAFSGFAKQKDPDIPTVQGSLERALGIVFRCEIPTVCSGRTDAGVHGRRQTVSFEAPLEMKDRALEKLRISLNALTEDAISVLEVFETPEGFSARFDAEWRQYRYRICTGSVPPLFLQDFAWWHKGTLDVDAMRQGAQYLVGEHDFKSFCKKASAEGKSTNRCVHSITLFQEEQMGEECLVIEVIGNAFLHSMVRTIVGTLVEVGCGRKAPEWVAEVLAACDRDAAGPNAPACGLTFWDVNYPDGFLNLRRRSQESNNAN